MYVKFPESMDLNRLQGKVSFYRPSSKKLDFSIPFSTIQDQEFEIPEAQLVKGRWNVKVTWQENEKEYMLKKEIVY